jgi:hypothetical protein
MPPKPVTVREVINAIRAATPYLEWARWDPARALDIMLPYADCEEFTDAQPDMYLHVRNLVCAAVGDCYRELGQVNEAVEWYYRARICWKEGGASPFWAPVYALVVVDHRLADHYDKALECLRALKSYWLKQPLLSRLYWNIVSGWWFRPHHWRMRRRKAKLIPQLEALIKER